MTSDPAATKLSRTPFVSASGPFGGSISYYADRYVAEAITAEPVCDD